MIKKINLFLFLLLFLVSISAVSALEDMNETDTGNNMDIEADISADESDCQISLSQHTISESNYNQYFDSNGNLVSQSVNEGDTINLEGSFSSKNFIFNKKVNIVGTDSDMKNSMLTLLAGASGSSVYKLNIQNTNHETYGIFLNSASNCIIHGCNITNTGRSSYCICIANSANNNTVADNNLKAYGINYGHGSNTRSTPPLLISGSHYNNVSSNHVEADDANGIYLSSYPGGPLNGGLSNFNTIRNNYIHYNVLPTSWAYGIQVMGNNNTIDNNTVVGAYRGVSTAGSGNIITKNRIINLTGADYNNPGVETGGEYGIVASYDSRVEGNEIISSKAISTGAGISALDNSVVENNTVKVRLKGRGIVAGGSNVLIKNNTVFTELGSGVYQKDEGSGLRVECNNITSVKAVGILIEKVSSKRMPSNVTIINNIIVTGNDYAIDASGVQADTSYIDESSNTVYGKLINTPSGVIDTSKPTFIYRGTLHRINQSNIADYINDNGGLTSLVNDTDILCFSGNFYNQVIYINKGVKITGENPVFYNSTFKVTSENVLIENLTIINDKAERVNAWGIFVNQATGVRIINNNIKVTDPKAAYAVYVLNSVGVEVLNNVLSSQGDFLTFTLLSYECEDCVFLNNTINTSGTGQAYKFSPEKCIDGNELVLDGKSYCIDGNELVIDGRSYCIDGNELVIDGVSYSLNSTGITINGTFYCIDGEELVIDGKSYCIDGNELVIDGKSYGESYSTSNAHVVSEIYQTYGILLLYSSNNVISKNKVNVTSKLNESYSIIGNDSSQNSLVGIDLYYNSHNNTFSDNEVFVKSYDNYIYGMGVLGYFTGHSAPAGQGATGNKFISNNITLNGNYCAEGIIIGDESENTLIENNNIHVKSGVSYGIYFEMSQKSDVKGNIIELNSEVVYGILGYSSSDNNVTGNNVAGNGKDVYGILFSNGNRNQIRKNTVLARGSGEALLIKNLDSLGSGNAGVYLKSNSSSNIVENNNITSLKGYAVLADNGAADNIISDNYLDCENGIGDEAVGSSDKNNISYNYKFIVEAPVITVSDVEYLGSCQFNLTFADNLNGAAVTLYGADLEVINQTVVSDAFVSFNTSLGYNYTAGDYIFAAEIFKKNYKKSLFEIPFTVKKSNLGIAFNSLSAAQGDSENITLNVTDSLGNPVKGIKVKFYMVRSRDVLIGTAVSGDDGICKINYEVPLSLDLATYTLWGDIDETDNFNSCSVNASLTVMAKEGAAPASDSGIVENTNPVSDASQSKPVLSAKNIVKKKSKKIRFSAKLHTKKGKALKNKKITFKIKGKKYHAKTNKKGVATIILKKLKAGKYTIISSYGGCKIKNTIKIKK